MTVLGVPLHRETDGLDLNSEDVVKVFVDAYITIAPDDINGVTEPHTFTTTVYVDNGDGNDDDGDGSNFDPASGVSVTVTLTNSGEAVADPAGPFVGNTDVNGEFDVTFTSSAAGLVTGHASVSLLVDGVTLDRATDGTGSNSDDADKEFVSGTLRWLKVEGGGNPLGGATFEVCLTHDRFGTDIPDVCVDVADNGPLDEDLDDGELQLSGLVLGTYAIHETIAPDDYELDPDTETVVLTLDNPSNADGDPEDFVPVFVNINPVEGRMTGGGSVFLPAGAFPGAGIRVTHGFQLHCAQPPAIINNRLEVNWANSPTSRSNNHFHLLNLITVECFDDPLLDEEQPDADIDTLVGYGTGRFSGKIGGTNYRNVTALIEFTFTDDGEPANDGPGGDDDDLATYRIWIDNGDGVFGAGDTLVLTTDSNDAGTEPDALPITFGNHQAHHEIASLTAAAASIQTNIDKTHSALESTQLGETKIMDLTKLLLKQLNEFDAAQGGAALMATAVGTGVSGAVSAQDLKDSVATALAYWRANGVNAERLGTGQVDVQLSNLPGNLLGLASADGQKIWIDRDAAGWGWAAADSAGQVNLQSVVTHEVGHLLGFDHDDTGVMAPTLAATATRTDQSVPLTTTVTSVVTPQEQPLPVSAAQYNVTTVGLVTAPTHSGVAVARFDAALPFQMAVARFAPEVDRRYQLLPEASGDRAAVLNVVFDLTQLDSPVLWDTDSVAKVAAPNEPTQPMRVGTETRTVEELEDVATDSAGSAVPVMEDTFVSSTGGLETLLAMLGLAGLLGPRRDRRSVWQRLFCRGQVSRKEG